MRTANFGRLLPEGRGTFLPFGTTTSNVRLR